MPTYDLAIYSPPAPIALVTVRAPATELAVANVPMLLDTGADVSLLPREALTELIGSIQTTQQYELEGFDGTRSWAPVAHMEINFLGKSFRGQFLIIDGRHGVIGRNILNSLSIQFDGPSRSWRENR